MRDIEVSLRKFQTDTGGVLTFVHMVTVGATHNLEVAPVGGAVKAEGT